MRSKNQKTQNIQQISASRTRPLIQVLLSVPFLVYMASPRSLAVTSNIISHSSAADLSKGQAENTIVGSQGTIQLARSTELLIADINDAWSINSIVVIGENIFWGTSPNGCIYKYSLGRTEKIHPLLQNKKDDKDDNPQDANTTRAKLTPKDYLENEHIFAMAADISGRLLAAISGKRCMLARFETGRMDIIFEPNDAKYIFAITTDDNGNIYLGTGPQGKIYGLDSFGKNPKLLYKARDKNVLSLAAAPNGVIYAGSDGRGLIYRIDLRAQRSSVLYDSNQSEITSLAITKQANTQQISLYAAATSAKIAQTQAEFTPVELPAGQPELPLSEEENKTGLNLKIANTKKPPQAEPTDQPRAPTRPGELPEASFIYKITQDGLVTNIFTKPLVLFAIALLQEEILVAAGNDAQLFAIDPVAEEEKKVYEDKQSSQITAIAVANRDIYLGTANPAKLIKLKEDFASEGTYTSELIDASQPARWGKLQIDADIPKGCRVKLACRSGNVKDVNDKAFSDWTEPEEITGPVQLRCPVGRFCQYKLILQTDASQQSPLVREVAVAYTVDNVAPKVESLKISHIEAPGKEGTFKIEYKAQDDNGDKLIFNIDFRKITRSNWISLTENNEADNFEWNTRTVEDGRYEIRVTASDERNNTTTTKLTHSRVSEPVVVDNTPPLIEDCQLQESEESATLKFKVTDELSNIGEVHYTIDSNSQWIKILPCDLVYDTTTEDFDIKTAELSPGEHILTLRAADAVANTRYASFELSIKK